MNVNPGDLNKKIDIVSLLKGQNSNGFRIISESVIKKNIWAGVSQESANEKKKSGADMSTITKRFLIRYTKGINSKMYVKYSGEYYNIQYAHDYQDKHEYIEIVAELQVI